MPEIIVPTGPEKAVLIAVKAAASAAGPADAAVASAANAPPHKSSYVM